MPRKQLTDKQRTTIEEVLKGGKQNIDAQSVLLAYHCKDIKSAYKIANDLRNNKLVQKELKKRQEVIKEVIKNEGRKLVDILEEIFPRIERARILVEIAREGSLKEKLEALKEINKIGGEYPIEKDKAGVEIGELRILMTPPETKRLKEAETEEGEFIEIEE